MAIQLIAIRVDPALPESVRGIVEIVWRQDETGKCAGLIRQSMGDWMLKNEKEIVYIRDYLGTVLRVAAFAEGEHIFLRSVSEGTQRDSLLALPRFVTNTE